MTLTPPRTSGELASRALDVVVAAAALVLTSPALGLAALVLRATEGSPVLFRQERAGRWGEPFTILKLRTMRPVAPGGDPEDPARTSAVGAWLRACSLDELPQLVNVLRGDMALVGPRPLYPSYVPLYSAEQARRLEVRPGLTGLAQVSGRNALGWAERLALDVDYVQRRSLELDVRILLRTVPRVLARSGVRDPAEETWFTGEVVAEREGAA